MKLMMVRLLPALLALGSAPAWAGADAELVVGSGPDGYHSREVSAWVDLFDLPLSVDARHFLARNPDGLLVEEHRAGLAWGPTDWLLASFHKKKARGESFDIRTDEYAADLTVSRLWSGTLDTRLSLLFAKSEYEPNARPAVVAIISPLLPEAEKYSFGVEQALTKQWSVSLGYDDFRYSKDPVALARFLLRRLRRPNTGVFELTSFPDHGVSFGVRWQPGDAWTFNYSMARTTTVVEQKLDALRLDGSYRFNKSFQLGASVMRSTSSELKRPNGTTLVESSGGNYFEVSARVSFD